MRSETRGEATTPHDPSGGARGLPPLPDVLAEPFWDPEPYRTREAREEQRSALEAMARRMSREGLPAGSFDEAIACLDEAAAGAP
ncbi:MAG TPA: hypothetical protein VMF70_12860 [Gemmatimonadales bacterium]|nr:hypothetical protein [Gemmatimonadales bacterium]